MRQDLSAGTPRGGTASRKGTPTGATLPHTRLRGGDRLRGGTPLGPGHAGRHVLSSYQMATRIALAALFVMVAQVSGLFSCIGTPAFAAATTGTASVTKARPPVLDKIGMEIGGTEYVAYCAEAVNEAPSTGAEYTLQSEPISIPELDYVLYHGYDGKTVKHVAARDGSLLSEDRSRAATQAAVWLVIDDKRLDLFHYRTHPEWHSNSPDNVYQAGRLGNPDYAGYPEYADDEVAYQAALKLVEEAAAYVQAGGGGAEEGYAQLWTTKTLDSEDINYLQALVVTGEKGGSIELTKTSASITLTTSNRAYEVKNAEFGIYKDEDCTELAATLVTDARGKASCELIAAGTYWVKETKAPKGFVLDPSVREIVVKVGETTDVNVVETPAHTAGVILQKVDADGNVVSVERAATPQGDATLAGAEFEVCYYDGYYSSVGKLPDTAVRTWTFKSGDDGRVDFDEAHKAAGDDLYVDAAGKAALPLGTYRIQEKKAPVGYRISDTAAHLAQVVESDVAKSGAAWVIIGDWSSEFALEDVEGRAIADQVIRGGVRVGKIDAETGGSTPQGDASFAGAKFTVTLASDKDVLVGGKWYRKGQVVMTLVADEDGVAETTADALPYGTYRLTETEAPEGYELNADWGKTFSVRRDGEVLDFATGEEGVPEQVIRGGVRVGKIDHERGSGVPQGDAKLDATFAITLLSEHPVVVSGELRQPGEVVMTLAADAESGIAETASDALPYGRYRVTEAQAPEGYLTNTEWSREFTIKSPGKIINLTSAKNALPDQVIRGGVRVGKYDWELDAHSAQGDATLAGAVFSITLLSDHEVRVDGSWFATGEVVKTLTTDSEGLAQTSANTLPYGTYLVQEAVAPEGYLLDSEWQRTFSIREDGQMVDLGQGENALPEQVIRGGVRVDKVDVQNGQAAPQGAATFEGATFSVTSESEQPVVVGGSTYAKGDVVITIQADAEGHAETDSHALPYGTYSIRETEAPEGYLLNRDWVRTFSIREDGTFADYTLDTEPEPELVIRGDLEGVKAAEQGMSRLAGVPFAIVSQTTGEWHVVVSDANAQLSTESSWNPHTSSTNANDACVEQGEDGSFALTDGAVLDDTAGVWFHGRTDLPTLEVRDDLGALPFDTYRIVEVPCSANEGLQMLDITITVSRNARTVDLGTLDDQPQPATPGLATTLTDADGSHVTVAGNQITLVDRVVCYDLVPGTTYDVRGTLHLRADDGTDAGVLAEGSAQLLASAPYGTAEITFAFDAGALEGMSVVAFEDLLLDGELLATHADIDDEGQTVSFPKIGTTLTDEEGAHETAAIEEVVLVDTVVYEGLEPGKSYDVEGILMDKQSGEPVLVSGEPVVARTSFVPSEQSGEVEVTFRFDGSSLRGMSIVAFETLRYDNREVAVHADLDDETQTVTFPRIGTKLTDEESSHEVCAGMVTLIDTVSYEHLTPGVEYTLVGTLQDREHANALEVEGGPVVASVTFVPEEANGTVQAPFTFDASALAGHHLVAFEELYAGGRLVACHADLDDEGQTVSIPSVTTTLEDDAQGGHLVRPEGSVTLVDTVLYHGLVPERHYVVTGTLMDKETGEPLAGEEGPVTTSVELVPEEADGSISLVFTFDASLLAGKTVVAFERIDHESHTVAVHTDIEDEDQSVHFPQIGTTATTDDGSHTATSVGRCTIHDMVAYENLLVGREYVLVGTLMDKETSKPLNTNEGTATVSFIPEEPSGSVEVTFEVDATTLAGLDVVAFEELLFEGKVIAVHADINDEGQTVSFPRIGTTLTSENGTHETQVGRVKLVDTVAYEGLVPGVAYTMTGTLMDRQTKEPVVIGEGPVQASTTFTPEQPEGTVEVVFTFDASGLAGHDVVAFEGLALEGSIIALHADINDEGQTVAIVEKPDEPDEPEEPDKPDEPEEPEEPDKPDKPDKPQEPEKPEEPEKPSNPPRPGVPKTSDLLLPVLPFLVAGLVVLTIGFALYLRSAPDAGLTRTTRRGVRRTPTPREADVHTRSKKARNTRGSSLTRREHR